jgi:hypothetical protein
MHTVLTQLTGKKTVQFEILADNIFIKNRHGTKLLHKEAALVNAEK